MSGSTTPSYKKLLESLIWAATLRFLGICHPQQNQFLRIWKIVNLKPCHNHTQMKNVIENKIKHQKEREGKKKLNYQLPWDVARLTPWQVDRGNCSQLQNPPFSSWLENSMDSFLRFHHPLLNQPKSPSKLFFSLPYFFGSTSHTTMFSIAKKDSFSWKMSLFGILVQQFGYGGWVEWEKERKRENSILLFPYCGYMDELF